MTAFKLLPIVLFILALLGCNSTLRKDPLSTQAKMDETPQSPEQLIAAARLSTSAQVKASFYLLASQKYFNHQLLSQSYAALADINPEDLSHSDLLEYLILSLKLSTQEKNNAKIEQTLSLIPSLTYDKASIQQQLALTNLSSVAYSMINKPLISAIILIENAGLFSENEYPLKHEEIWHLLRLSDTATLNQFRYSNSNQDVIGWLDLARLIQQNQINLEAQYQALQLWKTTWPSHPASLTLPHELNVLEQLPKTRPTSITLALPLSGPIANVGIAVRDGFMANHYSKSHSINSNTSLIINFFDTNSNDLETLYDSLSSDSLIIGPLDKKSLAKLQELDTLPVKTLALNYLDNTNEPIENLYQFGLSPETEIKQLTEHLAEKGLLKVGIIAPESNWGFRIHDSFNQNIQDHNGILIEDVYYQDQSSLSEAVSRLLNTYESKARKQKIQNIIQQSIEFLPRRRKDIDAIFMVAKPDTAKQLKPLFAYHYASDLPVFATSQIHTEQAGKSNEDLESIQFIEMPWMLSKTIDIKNKLNQIIPESRQKYSRFYALGVDAYDLAPRITLLQEVKGSHIQGQTGSLSMNNAGVISRHMELAKFRRGKAISIKE